MSLTSVTKDDFYLNLVDWSDTNILGVGLASCVYLWSAETSQVTKLTDLSIEDDSITALDWVQHVCRWTELLPWVHY